jgi:hypothetical protein
MSFSRTVVHVLVFWRGARGRQRVRTWALDVADDGTGLVVHELDAALSDTATGAGSAKDTGDLDEVDGGLSRVHFVRL